MRGLSKLGIGWTVVLGVCLFLLLAEVSYLLWCRRRFRSKNATVESNPSVISPSKELFYFCCWKKRSRIEPAAAPTAPTTDQEDTSSEFDNPLKWQILYGTSRLLFTIKEEEREDLESEKSCSAEENPNPHSNIKKRVSLGECFEITREVAVDVDGLQTETTPFSTPCASPPYCTPSSSPLASSADEGSSVGGLRSSININEGR
ncbi:hypothetical protein NE237_004606 [Protea cynaroides]|uniref:Uncharacterized protein n=1 Tax=Protea cynaroides TaxID=273540 RepID=A0A9Q0KJ73_9MAGN|nr:hypothetical protein NE237_004606 [Protea cynaroides]